MLRKRHDLEGYYIGYTEFRLFSRHCKFLRFSKLSHVPGAPCNNLRTTAAGQKILFSIIGRRAGMDFFCLQGCGDSRAHDRFCRRTWWLRTHLLVAVAWVEREPRLVGLFLAWTTGYRITLGFTPTDADFSSYLDTLLADMSAEGDVF